MIKIQPKTIYLSTRLWEITTEFVEFISWSFVLGSIDLGWIIFCQTTKITEGRESANPQNKSTSFKFCKQTTVLLCNSLHVSPYTWNTSAATESCQSLMSARNPLLNQTSVMLARENTRAFSLSTGLDQARSDLCWRLFLWFILLLLFSESAY